MDAVLAFHGVLGRHARRRRALDRRGLLRSLLIRRSSAVPVGINQFPRFADFAALHILPGDERRARVVAEAQAVGEISTADEALAWAAAFLKG